MSKKAQVLIIFLWILVVLVILVVSIGHRASMTFRFICYQKDKQKTLYLAKAGINRAVVELKEDKNGYDSLNEDWSTGVDSQTQEPIFTNIELIPASGETFTVTITDEERKININKASKDLLTALLEDFDISPAEEIARNILVWCGKIIDDTVYESLGYPPKKKDFVNTEELMLVKGITPQDYQKLKESITVHGNGLININTASDQVLRIFAYGVAKELGIAESSAKNVVDQIITLKSDKSYFKEKNEIDIRDLASDDLNMLGELKNRLTVESSNFFIEAIGRTGKIESQALAVYNRDDDKKILYWHEN